MATLENGAYTEYTFDRGSIIADFDKNEDRTTRYIRGFDLISQEDEEGVVNYYLHNAHGDITKLVDKTGNVQNSYSYDAFGNITAYTEKVENRFRYAGEQYDTVTGEIYLRARYYEPEVGRFTQEDQYRGDGLNLYVYVSNNPVLFTDSSGYCKDNQNNKLIYASFDTGSDAGEYIPGIPIPFPGREQIEEVLNQIGDFINDGYEGYKLFINLTTLTIIVNIAGIQINLSGTEGASKTDPYGRAGQKKQGRERKNKARQKDNWEPRSNPKPPKKHTPGREHRKY